MDKILIPSRKGGGKAPSLLTGFILSAGLGERLLPITNHIPKPLLPILGKPLLELILEKVSPFVDTIGMNLHHKKEDIAEYVDNSPFKEQVTLFYEEPILGTGGALKNAEALLSKGSFLVHNGDILSDIDLKRLIEFHHSSGNIATLAVHDYPQSNNLLLDDKGFVKGIFRAVRGTTPTGPPPHKPMAFTGIAIYEPGFLDLLSPGVSSILDAWMRAVDAGLKIGTMDVSGSYWTDIGAPSAYAAAVVHALRASGETIYIHPGVNCGDAELDGYIVIERGCIPSGVTSLRNCILLAGSRMTDTSYENCIICHNLKIELNESEMLGFPKNEAPLIGVGGSDRRYYRRRKGEILVRYTENDVDFHRHIEFTQFFRRHNIPVPELIDVDHENMAAVFEDLGDLSLYSWLKCKRETAQIEGMYSKAIDILLELHTTATSHASECPLLQERVFDYEVFTWETDYFMEGFVYPHTRNLGIGIKDMATLKEEFHRLGVKADSFAKTIIHRDFQSRNIMVKKGIPRLIDYQGARMGPPAYDVASILWDPYSRLDDGSRGILLNYYTLQMEKRLGKGFKGSDFNESLTVCRLQRHMQALGAYGLLSTKSGKGYFLKHIPEGLRLLKEDIIPVKSEYPALYELVIRL